MKAIINCYTGLEVTHRVSKIINNNYTLADFQNYRMNFIESNKDIFTRFETELIK